MLVSVSVALGFAIALGLALVSHRRRWLTPAITGLTGVLYTVPSIAFFLLLIPITGRGTDTAIIALTAYTLQIIYRNAVAGLANVPAEARDSGRGMGMTPRQLLLAGRAAARGARDHRRPADRDGVDGGDCDARGLRRGGRPGGRDLRRTSPSRPASSSAAASRS